MTFKDWYADTANRNFVTLQTINEKQDWGALNGSFDKKVETFDFRVLVEKFDAAQAANSRLSAWSLMNGLLDAHLGGNDNAALGGEIAARYAEDGSLAMTPGAAQEVLRDARFGTQAQSIGTRLNDNVHGYRIG